MEDIHSILSQFQSKRKTKDAESSGLGPNPQASTSEIPDVFFDVILKRHKLTRPEIGLLMYLYRQIWCRPNLYRKHGIGPLNSYAELSSILEMTSEDLMGLLHALEKQGFIETVRSGQYFVRKYFTEELDALFGQNYDEFF